MYRKAAIFFNICLDKLIIARCRDWQWFEFFAPSSWGHQMVIRWQDWQISGRTSRIWNQPRKRSKKKNKHLWYHEIEFHRGPRFFSLSIMLKEAENIPQHYFHSCLAYVLSVNKLFIFALFMCQPNCYTYPSPHSRSGVGSLPGLLAFQQAE